MADVEEGEQIPGRQGSIDTAGSTAHVNGSVCRLISSSGGVQSQSCRERPYIECIGISSQVDLAIFLDSQLTCHPVSLQLDRVNESY